MFNNVKKVMMSKSLLLIVAFGVLFCTAVKANNTPPASVSSENLDKTLVYIVSDFNIPFWKILGRGIQKSARTLGYKVDVYSANNSAKRELELTIKAIQNKVTGIIISPTTSSAAATILKFAKKANIPVVIADIGTDGGEYVSYISSDNRSGAYEIGKILATQLKQKGWENSSVGIIAISQKRSNGRARTAGFMQAMKEANIKSIGIKQQATFTYQESYDYSIELIKQDPNLRAIWIQGSDRYQAVLDAINYSGKKDDILLASFDAEPIFLELIPKEIIVGAAMQQPFLMGNKSVIVMDSYLNGRRVVKNFQLPILAISSENIAEKLPVINRNVLGIELVKH